MSTQEPDITAHYDVLIVGAGISGIGAAWYLQHRLPGKCFALFDAHESFGGTWHTHRYPGVRSDSDLFTFGYGFKPWKGAPIASAQQIRDYLAEVIDENGLAPRIHYRQRVLAANWVEAERHWVVDMVRTDTGETQRVSAGFVWMCQGYYRHEKGYTPSWPDMERFKGRIVHPQTWPEDLSLAGRKVVVIGSGATAATLIPAIADECAHVTMLQRSPTYFVTGRNANALADMLREIDIRDDWIHEIVRRKVLFDQAAVTRRSFSEPDKLRAELLGAVREQLGGDFDVERHFTPTYRPWRQRIAFIPDGDFFRCIRAGKASVATDHIERFTAEGIALQSGEHLDADVIITATGFDLNVLGDIDVRVDGETVSFADSVTWRGALFTGLPNLAWVFGYFRASWTLRADLVAELVCRLLAEMDRTGSARVEPVLGPAEKQMTLSPWVDPENFNPGYLMRGLDRLPRQGDRAPWLHTQDYMREKDEFPVADLHDGSLRFD